MSDILKIEPEDLGNATIELLLKIYASNTAFNQVVIEMLSNGDKSKADHFLNLYDELRLQNLKSSFQDLFQKYGSFGLDDILSDS